MARRFIDGLPINSMVDLSSSQTVSHNQMLFTDGLPIENGHFPWWTVK